MACAGGENKNQRGFTLTEMLVVIFILGILGAVVLANLGSGREQARDTAILETMQQIQTHQVISYSYEGGYAEDPCSPTPGGRLEELLDAIDDRAANPPVCSSTPKTGGGYENWRVSVEGNTLDTDAGERYCVDSDGFLGVISYGDPTGDFCPQGL